MKRATAEERALARAATYRLLALAFSYPTDEVRRELARALDVAAVGADLVDSATMNEVVAMQSQLSRETDLEASHQRIFTLSYSEDCPLYETAFGASHLFQQTQQQADIAGFYRAFGVDSRTDRSDHLSLELEFLYLLSLKEARARELGEAENIRLCRSAQRVFLRDHLARWAPLIGARVALTGRGSWFEAAGRLLIAFIAWEERFLRLPAVDRYRDEPVVLADEPGEMTCPLVEAVVPEAVIPEEVLRAASRAV